MRPGYNQIHAGERFPGMVVGVALAVALHAAVAGAAWLGMRTSNPQPLAPTVEAIFVDLVSVVEDASPPLAPIPVEPAEIEALPDDPVIKPLPEPEPLSEPKLVSEPELEPEMIVAPLAEPVFELPGRKPNALQPETLKELITEKPVRRDRAIILLRTTDDPEPKHTAVPPLQAAAATPQSGPISTPPSYAQNPIPPYPPQARRRQQEGLVVLRVLVNDSGRAVSVEIQASSGHRLLDRVARRAVMNWIFRPATQAGTAVQAFVEVPVRFSLKDT